jgi:predicted small metal-binding protein
MKEFACGDVVPGCSATFQGQTDEDILRQIGPHAKDAHGMADIPDDLRTQVQSLIRTAS